MKTLRFLMYALVATLFFASCEELLPIINGETPNEEQKPGNGGENNGENEGNGGNEGDDSLIDINKTYPLVSSIPSIFSPNTTEDVIIVLNGKGTAIDGFTGDVYAHTGVLTNLSSVDSDWKYVKAEWTVNTPDCKLTKHGNNLWSLTIKGGPRAFYGVPASEKIKSLAFVFRSADGSKEVKDNGKDIFVDAVDEGLYVKITSPKNGSILTIGEECLVSVKLQAASSMSLYCNDSEVLYTEEATAEYTFVPTKAEDIIFKAVATDGFDSVEDVVKVSILGTPESEPRPAGIGNGVTINGNEATFVLYAPGKESVVLLGDFNDYAPSNEYMMKRDGDYFWTTVSGLEQGVEYGYQYLVDRTIRIGDPYSTKILDPWNDQYITSVYPNLKPYPAEYTEDVVSVFELNPTKYQWQIAEFDRPAENSLAIYELLIRDFTTTRTIDAVTAKLDYLETLGINAIELMPIQEFDGNDSWGYNPCFYFAADKAYGTETDYKEFIDECHRRGIAVIVDVVFNHATGQCPYAKMWWDSGKNKTASNNPFFNVDAPHGFSVYHDFKHTFEGTVSFFDEVLKFWLEEYNVDGFRFDLTKGFVQNPGNYDAYGYSAQRIGILKHYAETIRSVEEDAYIIFEHFCDQSEETELYNSVGALCWNNNQMNGYMESVMGWTGDNKSNFSDFKKGRVNNIETHDEERIAYKAITWGDSKSNWAVISKRLQAAYAFHFLTPYPKMMWQFGELGYDVSINADETGKVGTGDEYRTHRKPVRWEYLEDVNRKALYDALSKIISWRTDNEEYYGQDNLATKTWAVGDANMGGKTLVMDRVIVVANFTNSETTTNVNVPSAGEWTNLLTGDKVQLGSSYSAKLAANDYIVLVK